MNSIRNWWRWANEADIFSALNPWREARDLRAENQRLLDALADPLITGMNYTRDAGCGIGIEAPAAVLMAGMFLGMFERSPSAKNYLELTFSTPQGRLLVTVVRPGGKTPHQLRMDAERKLTECMIGMGAETAYPSA